MKKSLTIILCAVSIPAFAQPQLKSSNLQIGDAFGIYQISGITLANLASSGTNIAWSAASGTTNPFGTLSCVDPSTTTYGTTYPNANFAFKFVLNSGTIYNFMRNSPNGSENIVTGLGSATPTIYITYNYFLPFTMNYGDSISKPFQKSGQSSSMQFLKYDAYGTLTTSDSSYSNIGRIYYTDLQSKINVLWYAGGGRYPVLMWDGSQFLYFKKKTTTGISETKQNISFEIFPNPVSNELNIVSKETVSKVAIYSVSGKTELTGSQSKIDVSNLSQGIYFVKVYSENGIAIQKFIKE